MLKAEDLARREDRRVKGVKIGKTRRDRGISHVWLGGSRSLKVSKLGAETVIEGSWFHKRMALGTIEWRYALTSMTVES